LPEDEEPIRRIAKELNDKLTDFQETYPGRDKQDCLSMLLLIYAVDLYKVKDGRAAIDPKIGRSLNQLESTLKSALVPSR
jgi:cell division protein ZapA